MKTRSDKITQNHPKEWLRDWPYLKFQRKRSVQISIVNLYINFQHRFNGFLPKSILNLNIRRIEDFRLIDEKKLFKSQVKNKVDRVSQVKEK